VGIAPGEGRLQRWLWRWMFQSVVGTFGCNSRFLAGAIEAHGIAGARVRVIHNAASRQWPDGTPRPACDPHLVVFVGQVIPLKGLLVLLEAIALLRGRGIAARLDVIGTIDGWESPSYAGHRAQVKARAARPDLAGAVNFLGHREDVLERLAVAAVHCCPSLPELREGLAGVVLEAKEAGVPSVVTPTGSLPEMIEHGVDGWVTPMATAEAVADGLERYLRDPAERARAAAAALQSRARFSRKAFAGGWLALFDPPASSS
jgi:glycosyltransferase involved in cell wall biosynthesis